MSFPLGSTFSDDTGCPSSQCASPTKTPSGSDNSPLGSPALGERKVKVKRVRMNVVAEWSAPTQKHKGEKQQRSPIMNKGHFISAIIATFLYSIYIFILFSLDSEGLFLK